MNLQLALFSSNKWKIMQKKLLRICRITQDMGANTPLMPKSSAWGLRRLVSGTSKVYSFLCGMSFSQKALINGCRSANFYVSGCN